MSTATAAPTSHVAQFKNQPPVDFAIEENRQAMQAALEKVRGQLGGHYPLVIGGENINSAARLTSRDPSHAETIVGTVASATPSHALQAVDAAAGALAQWRGRPAIERAELLRAAAAMLRRRLFELAAWEVFECGKNWREATADVDEAIDFCEYYAACALDLFAEEGNDVPGEENRFLYQGRGVAAVIAPWNFPIAILCGMTTANLVCGNTVVMKPAEQSPIAAAKLMEVFTEAGFPPGVVNYLPGTGEAAGATLVDEPRVAMIAFTGSRSVGLAINARAAEISTQAAANVKRVLAEMGGKNAIIVADDADLDEAVAGVVASAFGYQGQKCSACSRAIVMRPVYEQFLERLVEAARSLPIGPAEDPGAKFGPVIDAQSLANVKNYIAIGRTEGREVLAVDVGPLAEEGNFIGPHIFADVAPTARIAQEEIFGPVLAVIPADTLDEAIAIANGTDYALTGGIFSRGPATLAQAARQMQVGNLYLNRGTTGALVSRQPFGGFRMSGIGSKAGGEDYLLQFVVPRTITENTLRRGFAPPAD